MTVDEFLDRVAEVAAEASGDGVEGSPLQRACWFVAMTEASEIIASYGLKDFAGILLDGLPLGGPFRNEYELADWIQMKEDMPEDEDDPWGWLDAALASHFGIER